MDSMITQPLDQLDDAKVINLRDQALLQQQWTRQYMLKLVESIPKELWYVIPAGMTTNLAWQIGHLAVSQYGLMLFRQRGRAEGDTDLVPGWLRKQFGRGTTPPVSTEGQPSPDDLLARLNRVHEQSVAEASQFPVSTLREVCDMPYCVYANKIGAILFAPIHEGIHAGQIGALRRGHGLDPLR
jgi:hypothetical protein